MSRIGKKPVAIPAGVSITVNDRTLNVEGPKGKLTFTHRSEVSVEVDADGKEAVVSRMDDSRPSREFHGLTRAILANMIVGVTQGYEKKL
ncbi:50S ribosomal protein L6, partial [Rhodopirellula sallentina]|uniref:50S ribosomal protein L6 n=1 Tax=Rhodopirellula sallentina TaxID=1263869 RepID=UPI0005C7BE26